MSLPETVTMVTVTGTVVHPITGLGANGTATFAIPDAVRTSDGVVIGNLPDTVVPVVNGVFAVTLPATDDPDVVPQGWLYTVTVVTDALVDVFKAALPSTPNPTTFAAMVPVNTTTPPLVYVPLTALGVSVARLVDGTVPLDELPSTAVGVQSVTAGNATIAVAGTETAPTVAVGTGIPQSSITGLPAALAALVPEARQVDTGTGLAGGGPLTADLDLSVVYGSGAGTAAQGNDPRLSDPRTPTAHAATHAAAGSDPVTPAAIGAYTRPGGGIPASDLAAAVQTDLGDAGTALQPAIVTARGDLLAGTDPGVVARLAVGGTGQVLTADPAAGTGLRWADAGGGGGFTPVVADELVTNGNIAFPDTSGAWLVLNHHDGTTPMTLSVAAAVGHRVWISSDGLRELGGTFDYAVLVAGAQVRYLATLTSVPAGDGNTGWYSGGGAFATFVPMPGRRSFVVANTDLDGGTLTLAMVTKGTGTGSIVAGPDDTFYWCLENTGPTA